MPNPKVGTVTFDVGKAVREVKAGKVEFRVDKAGIVHVPVGKRSFGAEKLLDNVAGADREPAARQARGRQGPVRADASRSPPRWGPSVRVDPLVARARRGRRDGEDDRMKRAEKVESVETLQDEFARASVDRARRVSRADGAADEPAAQGGARGRRALPRGEEPPREARRRRLARTTRSCRCCRARLALLIGFTRPGRDGEGRRSSSPRSCRSSRSRARCSTARSCRRPR